jgi:hypothetical protein
MLVCFLTTTWAAAQTQRYVSATGTDSGNCGSSGSPCATINYAVGQAASGDVINVAGNLTQTSTINKSNITIKGAGAGSTKVRAALNSQTPVFTVTANNITFESMSLSNGGTMNGGIWVQGATTGLTVKGVTFDSLGKVVGSTSGTAGSGIRFLSSGTSVPNSFSNVLVDNCIFKNYDTKSSVGIVSSGCVISNVTVNNSQFEKLFIGLWSSGPVNGLSLTGNTFTMESLDNSSGTAAIYLGDVNGSIQNVKVENNTFTDFTRGFYINSYSTAGISNSLVKNIEILNNSFTNSIYSSAIRIITSADATIENLKIEDNTINQSTLNNFTDELPMIDIRQATKTLATSEENIYIHNNCINFSGGIFPKATWGILLRGKIFKAKIEENVLFGGNVAGTLVNAQNPNTSGIVVQTDFSSPFGRIPSDAQLVVQNNYINGFENGLVFYDRVQSTPTTFMPGGLPNGASIRIRENHLANNIKSILSGPGAVISTTSNWFGADYASQVSSNVDLVAPLCSGVDLNPDTCKNGFQPSLIGVLGKSKIVVDNGDLIPNAADGTDLGFVCEGKAMVSSFTMLNETGSTSKIKTIMVKGPNADQYSIPELFSADLNETFEKFDFSLKYNGSNIVCSSCVDTVIIQVFRLDNPLSPVLLEHKFAISAASNPLPDVSIKVPSIVCSGDDAPISLTAKENVEVTYKISGGTNQTTLVEAGLPLNLALKSPSLISELVISSVQALSTSCLNTTPKTIPLQVAALPTISINQNKTACAGTPASVIYTANQAVNIEYTLNGEKGSTTLTALSGSFNLKPLDKFSELLVNKVTSLVTGCQDKTPVVPIFLRVDEVPTLAGANVESCSDESFSLPLSSSANSVINWTATYNGLSGGAGSGGNATGVLSEVLKNTGTSPIVATYFLTPVNKNNSQCVGITAVSTVTINPTPKIITPTSIPTYCSGESFQIPVSLTGNGVLRWKREDGVFTGSGNIQDRIELTGATAGIVRYQLEAVGCKSTINQVISVNIAPTPNLTVNTLAPLCDAFTDITGAISTNLPGVNLKYFQDVALTMPVTDPKKVSQGTYFILGEKDGCKSTSTIYVRSQLRMKLSEPETLCPDKSFDLTKSVDISNSTTGLTFSYWANAEATQVLANPGSVAAGTYYVKGESVTPTGACSVLRPINVNVFKPEISNIPSSSVSICSGSTFDFTPILKDASFQWFRNFNSSLGLTSANGKDKISEILDIKNADNSVELIYGYTVSAPGCSGGTTGTFKVMVEKGPAFKLVDSAKVCDAFINLNTLVKESPANTTFSYFLGNTQITDLTKGIQGDYRVVGKNANGCLSTQTISVGHNLEIPKLDSFISCPPLTFDLKARLNQQLGNRYIVSFDNIPMPEKVNEGNYTVQLRDTLSSCLLVLPVNIYSGSPLLLNDVSGIQSLCSDEKFSFSPAFSSKDVSYTWNYGNGSGSAEINAVWVNKSGTPIRDSIRIISRSKTCNQSTISFVRVEIQPAPPTISTTTSDVCAGNLLEIGVNGTPSLSFARFSWKANYGRVEGGAQAIALNTFGPKAIKESLFHEEDTAVTVKYFLQSFLLAGNKTCLGKIDTISVDILPRGVGACGAILAGTIKTFNGLNVQGVNIRISGSEGNQSISTLSNGRYRMSGLYFGTDYTIIPQLNKNPLNGVSTFDLVLITKHILGLAPFQNPQDFIAADVNKSGSITTLDIIQLRKLILGIDSEFKSNTSWRFVDSNFNFKKDVSPFVFPELINLNDIENNAEANFYGIKIGDINGSVQTTSESVSEIREVNSYTLQSENKAFFPNEELFLSLRSDKQITADGIQFTLNYDTEMLKFQENRLDKDLLPYLGVFEDEGLITFSWSNTIEPDKLLLSLPFKAISRGEWVNAIQIGDRITRHEAYSDNRFYSLALEIRNGNKASQMMGKLPYPNPFNGTVHIPFVRNVDGEEVRLNVYDMTGRLVKTLVSRGNIGQDEFVIQQLQAGAEFNYELINGKNKYTGKLISVQQE